MRGGERPAARGAHRDRHRPRGHRRDGRAEFIYDLWGDTVNTASRMESHGLPGAIQVTELAYEWLRDRYDLRRRGTIEVKGKGPMTTYLLIGRRDASNAEPNFG